MWFIPWHRYTCVCFISPICLSPRKINPTIITKQIQNNIFHTLVLNPPPQYKVFLCVFIVSKVWERKTLTGHLHSNLLPPPQYLDVFLLCDCNFFSYGDDEPPMTTMMVVMMAVHCVSRIGVLLFEHSHFPQYLDALISKRYMQF